MAYTSDTIFHVTCDAEPLANAVSGNFFTSYGDIPIIEDSVFDGGWKMDDTVYADSTDSIAPTNRFTIGFWLKSVNPGVATNLSNVAVPLKMPVLSKATFTAGTTVTSSSYTFIVWEETQTDGTNKLKVKIKGLRSAATAERTLTSSSYVVGIFHHFWIAYDGTTDLLNLYIDTIQDAGATQSGTMPTTLSSNPSKLAINDNVPGERYEIARNQGTIDDIIIFNTTKTTGSTIAKAANNGALFVAEANYINAEEIDQAVVFDDPGTAQITSVHGNRSMLYVARSDGKLLRGTKLLWESRREFGNAKELVNLTTVNKGSGGLIRVSAGSLKIQDKIVRV